jgi:hypothetical protein
LQYQAILSAAVALPFSQFFHSTDALAAGVVPFEGDEAEHMRATIAGALAELGIEQQIAPGIDSYEGCLRSCRDFCDPAGSELVHSSTPRFLKTESRRDRSFNESQSEEPLLQ